MAEQTKARLNFVQIPQSLYDELQTKAENTLYFCPDTQRIHLADKVMSRPVQIVSEIPAERVAGNIYYCDGSLYYDDGAVAKSVSGEQDLFDEYSNSASASVKKISQEYLPDIQFQGKSLKDSNGNVVSGIGKSINFIGIGNVTVDDNGNITVRLGENLNSSEFEKTDGVTNGTCKVSGGVPSTYNQLPGNVDVKCVRKADSPVIKFATNGEVHLVGGEEFTVKVYDEASNSNSYKVGPILLSDFITENADGTKTIKSTSKDYSNGAVTLKVTGFGVEANSDRGATDYSATLTFEIALANTSMTQNYVSFVIAQTNGKTYTSSRLLYYITDTSVPSTTVSLSETKAKATVSGLTVLTNYSVTCTATADLVTPASSANNTGHIAFDIVNSWTASTDTTKNITLNGNNTYSSTLSCVVNNGIQTGIKIGAKADNINGYGSVSYATIDGTYLVDKHTIGTTDDLNEAFDNESYRLTTAYGEWVSSTSLAADSGEGKTGLMIYGGKLQYPAGDFSACDNGESLVQPNYDNCSGTRTYIRKFTKTGSLGGGTLTIGNDTISGSTLKNKIDGGVLKIEVAKDTHDKWYDVTKLVKDGGIGTGFNYSTNSAVISFAFTDGTSASDVYVRITMTKDTSIKLTSIAVDLA